MLGVYAKKIIKGIIIRNIQRGYIEIADEQLNAHISDFTETELSEFDALLEEKLNQALVEDTPVEDQNITDDSTIK